MKKIPIVLLSALFIILLCQVSYAATYSDVWYKGADQQWHVKDESGSAMKNMWFCDDAVAGNGKNIWYLLDKSGNMITAGLVQDGTGNFYSIETNHNGYYGMLRYKSGVYDGIYLDLEPNHNGSFAAIKNQDGIKALQAKYGITKLDINNSNISYSSNMTIPQKTQDSLDDELFSGGGGGGGGSSGGGGGSSGGGSSGNTTDSKNEAINEVVNSFISGYITDGMSDFEKEMVIIQWMVKNISYDYTNYLNNTIPAESYQAYGALVKKKAVCNGYAEGFQRLASACGLTSEMVSGKADNGDGKGFQNHAWNQICLDGNWYNLDVTWEDPVPSNSYGFGNLRLEYINIPDAVFGIKHKRSAGGHACTEDKYCASVAAYYLETGDVDTDMRGDLWRDYMLDHKVYNKYGMDQLGYKYDDNRNYSEVPEKAAIIAYAESEFGKGRRFINYCVGPNVTSISWLTDKWVKDNIQNGYFHLTFRSYDSLKAYYPQHLYGIITIDIGTDSYNKPIKGQSLTTDCETEPNTCIQYEEVSEETSDENIEMNSGEEPEEDTETSTDVDGEDLEVTSVDSRQRCI